MPESWMIKDSWFSSRHSERNHLHPFQPLTPLSTPYINPLVSLLLALPVEDWIKKIAESEFYGLKRTHCSRCLNNNRKLCAVLSRVLNHLKRKLLKISCYVKLGYYQVILFVIKRQQHSSGLVALFYNNGQISFGTNIIKIGCLIRWYNAAWWDFNSTMLQCQIKVTL